MGRPRKMTTDQMIEVVDSYYSTRVEGNGNLLRCSLIAVYATELGYTANGYDFRRNTMVRDYIDRLKNGGDISSESTPMVYKSLDVTGFINCNGGDAQLAKALMDLDAYWKRIALHAAQNAKENKILVKSNTDYQMALMEATEIQKELEAGNVSLSRENNRLVSENRYLRKILRTYLYPAIAEEILVRENALQEASEQATDAAISGMTELDVPKSFQESVANDMAIQSEEEQLLAKMWGMIDG